MSDYYGEYKTPSVYQSSATGGDSTVFLYAAGQSSVGGLIQLRARNLYNATVYAQLLNSTWPTAMSATGLFLSPTGIPTGAGSVTGTPSGSNGAMLKLGQVPVAVLSVPTGAGVTSPEAVLDTNTAHWLACPTGMIVAASSSPAIYVPINTGCINFTIMYKQ